MKTIGKHVANAQNEELDGMSTVAKFATVQSEGGREVTRQVEHYNLDMVLSVGYRVKSPEGIHFRRWATTVLHQYVLDGVAFDARRLEQLGSIVRVLSRSTDELVAGVAEVVDRYLPSLRSLRAYDEGDIPTSAGSAPTWQLTYDEARALIDRVGDEFPADTLFGGGGGERSAAALFVHFLQRNGMLIDANGESRVSNNALAAITLMVAMSDPKEKELMIALIASMLSSEGE